MANEPTIWTAFAELPQQGTVAPTEEVLLDGDARAPVSALNAVVQSTDAAAPNNSIYYSTDLSSLVYKDSLGRYWQIQLTRWSGA